MAVDFTPQGIAEQRKVIAEAIDMQPCIYRAAIRLSIAKDFYPAALDEIERLQADNAALREQVARLTRERDAEKRRADAGAIRTAVRPFEKGDKNTLTKYTQFCKRLAASHKPEMPSEDRMLLLLTDLCIDRLCVSMQGLTAERDAAIRDLKWLSNEYKFCTTCKRDNGRGVWDCNDERCDAENHYDWRGLFAENTDAPTGAESEQNNESES